jgi:hypothetical protein
VFQVGDTQKDVKNREYFLTARMPGLLALDQSGTGVEKNKDVRTGPVPE